MGLAGAGGGDRLDGPEYQLHGGRTTRRARSAVEGVNRSAALSARERRRGLTVLLSTSFFTSAGFFAVIPLISVQYVDNLGWTAGSVGLVLAVRQFAQQGSTTLSGALADLFGAKALIAAGMMVRACGFAVMAWADTFAVLMSSALLAALGGGLFESPSGAAIAALTEEHQRPRYYSLAAVVSGLETTIGAQVGALLIRADFALVALVGAGCFVLIFGMVLLFFPPVQVASERQGLTGGLRMALRDRPFMTYNLLMMGYWFMWTQFYIALPLAATDLAGSSSGVAWVYTVNSVVTISLGYLLPRWVERRMKPLQMLVCGIVVAALGLAAIAAAKNVATLLACVLVVSIGTVLVRPGGQTVTARLAKPAARGSFFGVAALSVAIGGGVGNYGGGVIYDFGQDAGVPEVPWLIFGAMGFAAAIGLWWTGMAYGGYGEQPEESQPRSPRRRPASTSWAMGGAMRSIRGRRRE